MSRFERTDIYDPRQRPSVFAPAPVQQERPEPTFGQLITSTFRHDNQIASLIANQLEVDPGHVDPEFNLWEFLRENKQEAHLDRYVNAGAWNRARAQQVSRQLEMEAEDRRVTDAYPWYINLPLGIAAGVLDPTVLMPGGALVRTGRGTYSVMQTARSVGLAGAGATLVQEAGLQATQLDRSFAESAMNIGAGAVLSALLGGAAAGLLTRPERAVVGRAVDTIVPDAPNVPAPEPRPEPPATPANIVDVEISGFRGYEFALTPANDILPERPVATEIPWGQEFRGSPQGTLPSNNMDALEFMTSRYIHDDAGWLYKIDRGNRGPIPEIPEWFNDVRSAVQELSEKLGFGRIPVFLRRAGAYGGHHSQDGAPGFLVLNRNLPRESAFAVAAHELGHYISFARLRHAPEDIKLAIEADYQKFVARFAEGGTEGEMRPLNNQTTRELTPERADGRVEPGSRRHEYLTSKEEWIADQISYWVITNRQPRTILEKFWKSISDIWRKLFDEVGKEVAPSIDRFMRGQWDNWHIPTEASGTITARTDGRPGFSAVMRAANENTPEKIEAGISGEGSIVTVSSDLSAAQVTPPPREALEIKGRMARAAASALSWMIPNFRLNFSYSAHVREIGQKLLETTAVQTGHAEGIVAAPGGAAETHARTMFALYAVATRDSDAIYREMVKAGRKMSRDDFGEQVGWALSNADTSLEGNEFVTRAAKVWRDNFFEPLLKEGQRLGLYGKDVTVNTASSYFPRQAIKDAFTLHHDVWMQRNVPYWVGKLQEAYNKELTEVNRKLAQLDEQIADLGRTPEERTDLVTRLSEQIETVRAQYSELFEVETRIKELRQQQWEGTGKNKTRAANYNELQQQINELKKTEGYAQYEEYIRRTSGRMRRLARVDPANKIEELFDKMLLEEDRAFNAVNQLLERGRTAERRMARLDPEEHAEAIVELRDKIEDFVRNAEARQAKLKDAILKAEREWSQEKAELVQLWKQREQQLGDPATRGKAAKDRERLREKIDEEQLRMRETQLEYEEKQLKRLRKDSERAERDAERYNRMMLRLQKLEAFDPEAARLEIRQALDELAISKTEGLIRRGQRIQRLIDRMNELDPKFVEKEVERLAARRREVDDAFVRKWEMHTDDARNPDFTRLATEISQEAADKYRGTKFGSEGTPRPEYIWTFERGPFKGRTYSVPDFVIDPPGSDIKFFSRNVYEVANLHGRQMAGDIAITRVFGDPTMRDVLGTEGGDGQPPVPGSLRESYRELEEAVRRATTVDEVKQIMGRGPGLINWVKEKIGKGSLQDVKNWALRELDSDMRGRRSDLIAARDAIRGLYQVAENNSSFGRLVRATTQVNYLRVMGGQGISMLTDLYRPAMERGLGAFMNDGIAQFMGNMAGIKASMSELHQMNLVTNMYMNRVLLTFADIGDPLAPGTPLERFLEKLVRVGSIWNGSRMVQDFAEGLGGTITQTHLLRIARDGTWDKHAEYLASLGLTPSLMQRIQRHFNTHGETFKHGPGEVLVAHSDKWRTSDRPPNPDSRLRQYDQEVSGDLDHEAISAFRNAVLKEVTSMFSTRTVGDVPFFMHTPFGRMLLQFSSFAISSYSRVLVRGLQGEQARFLGAIIPMTAMGALVAYVQAALGGNERLEKFQRNVDMNPGFLLAEALDRSGIFALPFLGANMLEAAAASGGLGRVNPIKYPLIAASGPVPRELMSTASQRDVVSQIAGPTAGLLTALPRAVGAGWALGQGDSPSKLQAQGVQQAIPFGTYPVMRQFIQWLYGDLPRW